MPDTKQCTTCHATRPTSDFYRRSRAKDGLAASCKECEAERNRDYRRRNREKVAEKKRARRAKTTPRKTCTKCHETKPGTQFAKDRRKQDGRSPICKKCRKHGDKKTIPAGAKKQQENARRYLKVVAQLHDARTDREPRKHECNYSGCTRPKAYKNDPHNFGFCPEHENNAAFILGYKATA